MEWQIIAAPGFQDITEAAGMTFHSAGHIIIDSEFGEPRYTADTIVHEILHACWANTPLTSSKKPTEEDVVRGLTPGITTVFLDNPEFYSAMRRLWRKGAK
jgi:histidinol-phosphate/aromatic aminotransferase/cobyric acid decarboxylase-like protein